MHLQSTSTQRSGKQRAAVDWNRVAACAAKLRGKDHITGLELGRDRGTDSGNRQTAHIVDRQPSRGCDSGTRRTHSGTDDAQPRGTADSGGLES